MTQTTSTDAPWLAPLWLGLLIVTSAALTALYTCITPFATFAAITATLLSNRQALSCMVIVWLANQVVGFSVLSYPWTAKTVAWGMAIGGAAVLGMLAAQWVVGHLESFRSPIPTVAGFLSAFMVYQVMLSAVAASLLGGTDAFAPRVIGQVLLINAVTFAGLFGLSQVVAAAALLSRLRRGRAFPVRSA